MNKRIQELIDQCYEPAPLFRDGFESVIGTVFNKEKFAELIIRECLDVMAATAKTAQEEFTYMGNDVPTSAHQMEIADHFGVE